MTSLYEKIKNGVESGFSEVPETPRIIEANLKSEFELRPYQHETFGYFELYLGNAKLRQRPSQLLFHMATGSGKTLVMAGVILRLYELGYRNFVFFVNNTTIINKTRENFLNPSSSKYLFNDRLSLGEKEIAIREVDNFEGTNEDDIQILFTTIQGLHSLLNTPRENAVTYADFEDEKIVLISDEAHHINAETKKGKDLNKGEQEEILSWEGTVNRIFRANAENFLLEFTATTDFSDPNIERKYIDKLLYDYPLKQFRKDGYSKEVKVLQADLPQIKRALQAVVLSQYRRKVFEKSRIRIKPVILFKSKTIKESNAFYDDFIDLIKHLSHKQLEEVKGASNTVVGRAFTYFEENGITLENLAQELKNDFSEEKCIVVNSKNESEEKQIAVNSLEDESNEYRAVFAVDKLNEGWDVLNLFDIVRLYNTRDAKSGKPGKTTMSEAQLIGRGARYCPFQLDQEKSKYMRKFDDDIEHELRIGEELYYHSFHNPKYIQELNTALQEIGIKAKESKEIHMTVKEEFKESDFFKKGLIFLNERKKYDRSDITGFDSTLITSKHSYRLTTGFTSSVSVFTEKISDRNGFERKQKDYKVSNFGRNVLLKALNSLDFYSFNNLKSYLPNLKSYTEFITSERYLGKIEVEVDGNKEQVENLSPSDRLAVTISVLEHIATVLESGKVEYKGTKEFAPRMIYKTFKSKVLNIAVNEDSDKEFGIAQSSTSNENLRLDLSQKDWYVFNDNYGTSEEKAMVKYINKVYDSLKAKYEKVYLVRNEKHFQLYNFEDGRPLEPDFVLFLTQKDEPKTLYYQIFIEPKGEHLLEKDKWKEEFLMKLKEEGKTKVLFENKDYFIIGMPFYNSVVSEKRADFEDAFTEYL